MTELETLYRENGDLRAELTRLKVQVKATEADLYQEQKKCKVLEIRVQDTDNHLRRLHVRYRVAKERLFGYIYGRPVARVGYGVSPMPEPTKGCGLDLGNPPESFTAIQSIELLPSEPSGELKAMAQHIRDLEMLLGLLPKPGGAKLVMDIAKEAIRGETI